MKRYTTCSSLANEIDGYLVLCAGVVDRAVRDARSRPNTHLQITPAVIQEARRFLASEELLCWLAPITPETMHVDELARRLRRRVFGPAGYAPVGLNLD